MSGLEGVRVGLMDGIDVSRGGDMEFLRGSTDSQWSCLYFHHPLLASAVRQFITKDMAVRSKLAAWIWASQAQWDDTHTYSLEHQSMCLSSFQRERERYLPSNPYQTRVSCTVDSRYHKNSMIVILLSNHQRGEF